MAEAPAAPAQAAVSFLAEVREARAEIFPAVGLGQDLRLAGWDLAGGALLLDGEVVHLCAFRIRASADQAGDAGTRLLRASWRGRRHAA
jgi:hypothetical protein